jgi:hypothetical protein
VTSSEMISMGPPRFPQACFPDIVAAIVDRGYK